MENLIARLNALEMRTRRVERQLRWWRLTAGVVALCAVSLALVNQGEAQVPNGAGAGTTVNAPFTIKGADGGTLLTVADFADPGRKGKDTFLTFYRNNIPAALFRTTELTYRDASDPKDNFLTVFETWLYRHNNDDGKAPLVPYLATSTALTREGGSFVVFNGKTKESTTTPPFAARLTSTNAGGRLTLYTPDGKEGRNVDLTK